MLVAEDIAPEAAKSPEMLAIYDGLARQALIEHGAEHFALGQRHLVYAEEPALGEVSIVWELKNIHSLA